jgi:hypothetical protein
MQGFVVWWCNLIGIVDPVAIQIATAIVGGGLLLVIILIAWQLAVMFINWYIEIVLSNK